MIELGVPGGYELYNYREAFKLGDAMFHAEKQIKGRMR